MSETTIRSQARARVPGDGLLNPIALTAIGLLIVNDHILKSLVPGLITGKVSDFAGLVFFPLLLEAAHELGCAATRRDWGPSQAVLSLSIAVTALTFAAVKLIPEATAAFASTLGAIQWLTGQILMVGAAAPWRVEVAQDPTDLMALPVLALTYVIGRRRSGSGAGQ